MKLAIILLILSSTVAAQSTDSRLVNCRTYLRNDPTFSLDTSVRELESTQFTSSSCQALYSYAKRMNGLWKEYNAAKSEPNFNSRSEAAAETMKVLKSMLEARNLASCTQEAQFYTIRLDSMRMALKILSAFGDSSAQEDEHITALRRSLEANIIDQVEINDSILAPNPYSSASRMSCLARSICSSNPSLCSQRVNQTPPPPPRALTQNSCDRTTGIPVLDGSISYGSDILNLAYILNPQLNQRPPGAPCRNGAQCESEFCSNTGPLGRFQCDETGIYCVKAGQRCQRDNDCCSNDCSVTGRCRADGIRECLRIGRTFSRSETECCSGQADTTRTCIASARECVAIGLQCIRDDQCCSNDCGVDQLCRANNGGASNRYIPPPSP